MRRELIAKLGLGFLAITTCGGVAGVGLANYAQSGAFEFYRQARVDDWSRDPLPAAASVESTDLAFASDYRDAPGGGGSGTTLASFEP